LKTTQNIPPRPWVGIRNISDYSPFGVLLKERTVESAFYRTSFQKQEHDDEVKGEGNSMNFKFRMYDPRIGRFFTVDPMKNYFSYNSVYAFCENRVIDGVDQEGLEFTNANSAETKESLNELIAHPEKINQGGSGTCVIAAITYIWLKNESDYRIRQVAHMIFFNGSAQVKQFKIQPSKYLQKQNPNTGQSFIKSSESSGDRDFEEEYGRELDADWLLISSIQNSLQGQLGQPKKFLGMGYGQYSETSNSFAEVEYLMKNFLGLSNVGKTYYTDRTAMDPVKVLTNLTNLQKNGYEIILAINGGMLSDTKPSTVQTANHVVTFVGNFSQNGSNISLDVQSWGEIYSLTMTIDEFKNSYFGSIYGKKEEKKKE
jgi:RHS repeat-associated protein